MAGPSKQRLDADNAFLRTQTQSLARNRISTEADGIAQARDANTARLRQQRLEKEAEDRAIAAAAPPATPKRKTRTKQDKAG